jgi:hypothetical protein
MKAQTIESASRVLREAGVIYASLEFGFLIID